MTGDFQTLLSKTITGIQVREDPEFYSSQIFLVFDDGTYFELYSGSQINGLRRLYSGDMGTVRGFPAGNSEIRVDLEHHASQAS